MLDFITVFNPSYSTNELDTHKQLLLHHSFNDTHEYTLNDKLSQIGIIQGIWSFTKSFESGSDSSGNVLRNAIDLEGKRLLTVLVEDNFYITLGVLEDEKNIPSDYYMSHLLHCYNFSVLNYGAWKLFEDPRDLTDCLNEYFIAFWNNFQLVPQVATSQGFLHSWPQYYKIAELPNKQGESWEYLLNKNVLLDDTTFLGLQDVLVYHLPKPTVRKGYKTYGFIKNFAPNCDSLSEISNWIYHLDSVFDRLSSHILAGNVHYKEAPEEAEEEEYTAPDPEESQSTGEIIADQSRKMLHNLTLPISFASDAIREVGNMTGVSSSMSLLTDYIPGLPSWPKKKSGSNSPNTNDNRHGFLISPMSADILPQSYKVRQFHLTYDNKSQTYNLLFWFYNEVLLVLVFKQSFGKIWDHEYLKDLDFKLRDSISDLYDSQLKESVNADDIDRFNYAIVDKHSKQVKSSFPFVRKEDSTGISPLELVVNGLDETLQSLFLSSGNNRKSSVATITPIRTEIMDESGNNKWGLGLMGGFFNKDASKSGPQIKSETFLDTIVVDKLLELHLDVSKFLNSLQNSRRKKDIKEEKLIKLNNGVLCYITDDEDSIVILVKNWFDPTTNSPIKEETDYKKKDLINSLGKDVMKWWENREI